MPYRRLPNTDSARIRSMKKALEMSSKKSPRDLAFSQTVLMQIRTFLPMSEQSVMTQRT